MGPEVAEQFDSKYIISSGEKFLLDVSKANYDMLKDFGIPKSQIEKSDLCSYTANYIHSFRRDKNMSGRAFGVISMKE